jgi:hypothetical protein
MPTHTILTMSRGDALRLPEWVEYHSWLGFDAFHIILDNPVDDSEAVLRSLDVPAKITIDVRPPDGDYYDGLTPRERYRRVLEWREANRDALVAAGLPVYDPLVVRQHAAFSEALKPLSERDTWVALIDVDEFIAIPGGAIQDVTAAATTPRVKFLNFNFDTTDHVDGQSFLDQHTMRWSREDLLALGGGWSRRVKTIARNDVLLPFKSVHTISSSPSEVADPEVARLHHYKIPLQRLSIPYSVDDRELVGPRIARTR